MLTYETKEQCLAANGTHAWGPGLAREGIDEHGGYILIDCQVCQHCPAFRVRRQVQEPKFEWIESE